MTTLKMFRGDDKTINLSFALNGLAQDISNWTIFFTAKRSISHTDAQAVMQKNNITQSDITITNGPQGLATISIFAADTSGLEDADVNLICDIQTRDGNGKVNTTQYLNLLIQPDVTRA